MTLNVVDVDGRVPSACTLSSVERGLRVAEFDEFFTHDAVTVTRPAPGRLTIWVRPEPAAASRAAALAVAESGCCAFLAFTLEVGGGEVTLSVRAEAGHEGCHEAVLEALADRAERLIGAAGR